MWKIKDRGGNNIWNDLLTHWPLGDHNVIFKNVIFNLALLIGIFKSFLW